MVAPADQALSLLEIWQEFEAVCGRCWCTGPATVRPGPRASRHSVAHALRASCAGAKGELPGFSPRALRHRPTAIPRPVAIHFCSCPKHEQCKYRPNLKDEYEDQHNAQSCGLEWLACSRFQSRSSYTGPQSNQRANPSIERTRKGRPRYARSLFFASRGLPFRAAHVAR